MLKKLSLFNYIKEALQTWFFTVVITSNALFKYGLVLHSYSGMPEDFERNTRIVFFVEFICLFVYCQPFINVYVNDNLISIRPGRTKWWADILFIHIYRKTKWVKQKVTSHTIKQNVDSHPSLNLKKNIYETNEETWKT